MKRSISTQVLVIGGGATGLGIAWDACLRGLKVVLIEQSDIAQGTSGRYHGLLHSGGRYAISDPITAQECARENAILRRIAPTTIEDTGGYFVSTPADPLDFPDRWSAACSQLEIQAEEIQPEYARSREPALSPRISRVFRVHDATLDSFELSHQLLRAIRSAGGAVHLHHRLESFMRHGDRVIGARVTNLLSGEELAIGGEIVINAAGPWAGKVGQLADLELPLSLGKGTMLAMAIRPVNTVINRCAPPSDGDIIVPIGTVAVLGTTDVPVQEPEQREIEAWEIDLLLAEAELAVPGISRLRPLRAWAGIRPLYRPLLSRGGESRDLPRSFAILDHEKMDGCSGLISVIGGKLTTFRLMAEETVNLICQYLDHSHPCQTTTTPLSDDSRGYHQLPARLNHIAISKEKDLICECELVPRSAILTALQNPDNLDFDAVRRDLRLGMGPCQGGFCAFRTAGLSTELDPGTDGLIPFIEERWRGIAPVCWGHSLREMEFMRRIYLELLAIRSGEAAA